MNDFSGLGYPKALVNSWADVVTRHIETLPPDYYKMMREFTENGNYLPEGDASIYALGFDFAEDYKKMLPPAVLVKKYTGCLSATLEYVLGGYDAPETIGLLEGRPVLFLRGPGQYYYEGPDSTSLLEVGLTGAFYPPVLPK